MRYLQSVMLRAPNVLWAALVALMFPLGAAAHTLKLSPSAVSVFSNESFSLDLIATDLDGTGSEPGSFISAFELDINFDAARLEGVAVDLADSLGGDLGAISIAIPGAGSWHLASASLLSDLELASLQGTQVLLAKLTFKALNLGTGESIASTQIEIAGLTQLLGGCTAPDSGGGCPGGVIQDDATTGTGLEGSTITIKTRPTGVPEPAVWVLLTAGLVSLTLARRGSK